MALGSAAFVDGCSPVVVVAQANWINKDWINKKDKIVFAGIMCDLLWSDPQILPGTSPSKRGVGVQFGPNVTVDFLNKNGLDYIIRSHEVKDKGYEVSHDGKCVTVFSAPNYW